jgi:hypothetical protein
VWTRTTRVARGASMLFAGPRARMPTSVAGPRKPGLRAAWNNRPPLCEEVALSPSIDARLGREYVILY